MKKINSDINLNYETLKVTKSRLNKGLLSIPVSLIDNFPSKKRKIQVFFDNNKLPEFKNFTPYTSSSKECIIGGMKNWYIKNKVMPNDEITLITIDKELGIYRLVKEFDFKIHISKLSKQLFATLEIEDDENNIENVLDELKHISNRSEKDILIGQYLNIKNLSIKKRKYEQVNIKKRKERVPSLIRKILGAVYEGKCQLTQFSFIQKNGKPYFEVHHIDENRGNDWKNLLVVSPNIHAQFTYGRYENYYDKEGWLRKVYLCGTSYNVFQQLDKISNQRFEKIIHG